MIKMPLKGEYMWSKNLKEKLLWFYADFESILVPENNGKQNPEESCRAKYQKHIAGSYGYKLVCVDNKLSKLLLKLKSYLGKDTFTISLTVW